MVVGLLVLTLGLIGVLAYQALDATRSHERIAQQTLKEHALFAAWELSSVFRRDLYSYYLGPGTEVVAKAGGAYPGVPLKATPPVMKAAESLYWPPGGLKELDYLFRLDLADGKLVVQGDAPPSSEIKAWLVAVAKEEAKAGLDHEKHARGMILHGSGENQRVVVLKVSPEPGPDAEVVFGFQTTLVPIRLLLDQIASKAPLLPPSLTKGKPTQDLVSFVILDQGNREIYRTKEQFDSPFKGGESLGPFFGGLLAGATLRPEAAELLVIGGLPKSRLPTILGLLALASGLVIAALFQIRREQELSLLRTDFVSSVSHQLRTPLAQIRMFGETLLLGRVRSEEEQKRSLEIIVKESQRLTHQVDNVLLFSRAQRQDVHLSPEPLLLAPFIRDALESFCPVAEAQDCRVEASLDEELVAVADPPALRQVILNLLENAVKYGPASQIVDVKLREGSPGTVRLEVEDEGAGIPADQRDKVFTPYARLDRDRDSGIAGSGIGLAVVKELVQRQGGSVWVEGARSGGARFVVELPEALGATSEEPGSSSQGATPSAVDLQTSTPGD